MICPRCGNRDKNFFFFLNGRYHCRKCISYRGEQALKIKKEKHQFSLKLKYPLSIKQEEISNKVLKAFINHQNVLIHAVCGAGKTELVFKTIEHALNNGLQVGFAIPRKDVVIDLYPRFIEAFPNFKVIKVYGGNHEHLEGDIIILTTHQLYRYQNYFDLLIIDETDAFPFYGDETLESFFKRSIKGTFIMLSATPLPRMKELIKKTKGMYLTLFERYHRHPLIVPKIIKKPFFLNYELIKVMRNFIEKKLPLLIFVPTIEICEETYHFIKKYYQLGDYVHSKRKEREEIISKFKDNKYLYLVTTSVLERGVTIKNLQVIIYETEHALYDKASLIQISGRVGRKIDAYDGEVIFLCHYVTSAMEESIEEINTYNQDLLNMSK